jgi:hypothetical protein
MCGGVECKDGGRVLRVYFPSPKAALPVRLKSGDTLWLPWGRREGESPGLPRGGWARIESIRNGRWEKYQPRSVVIPALRFMEKDRRQVSHWFDIPEGRMIQGLVANAGAESRVYVVTTGVPSEYPDFHDRWPRLVQKRAGGP